MPAYRVPFRRWAAAAALAAAVLAVVLGATGGDVSAHASLISSSPAAGEVLDSSPAEVLLTFDEAVELRLGELRVLDGAGADVPGVGKPQHPDGDSALVAASVPTLEPGSYVVSWNVVSADGHPIAGAFSFQVGDVSDLQPGVLAGVSDGESDPVWLDVGESGARATLYAGLALAAGGLCFLLLCRPSAGQRRVQTFALAGALVAVLAGLLLIPLQAEAAQRSSLTDPGAWWDVLSTRSGRAGGVRIVAMAVCAAALTSVRRRPGAILAMLGAGVAVFASPYAGHGASGRWEAVGIAATILHVAAMAVWMGGLVALAAVAARADASVARRFSPIATVALFTVVATGVVQTLRQVSTVDELTESTYGRWLMLKVAFAVLVLCGAMASRFATYGSPGQSVRRTDVALLRRALAIEIAAGVLVLASTGGLTGTPPPTSAAGTYSSYLVDGDYAVSVTIDPARAGPVEMHIYLSSASGSLDQPDAVDASLSSPERDIGSIELQLEPTGPGHYTAVNATIPFAGSWTLTIHARYGEFDLATFTDTVQVG